MSGPEPLSSLQNPRVKQLVKLRDARERQKSGRTRIDGARELLRAVEAGLRPELVYLCPARVRSDEARRAIDAATEVGAELQPVTEAVYEKIRYGERDEGLCAVAQWTPTPLSEIDPSSPELVLVVEGIEKPGNLGALLRTADAAGVGAVFLADPTCDPSNPNVVRASMGTLFTQTLAVSTARDIRAWLDGRGIRVVITRPDAHTLYTETDFTQRVAIVVGAEHQGLTEAWGHGDALAVSLPMAGFSDSLNVAATAAVMLYEALRQRAAGAASDSPSTA